MHHPDAFPTSLTRRDFHRTLATLAAFGLLDPAAQLMAMATEPKRLSWLANRTAAGEGEWTATDIEGRVPAELRGTLYRIGPGQKETHGVPLNHFFDGDALVQAYRFGDDGVRIQARFVETPERVEETAAGRMLYHEFGTLAPPPEPGARRRGFKNQPSINVVPWAGRLLGLSEGGHPSAIDPETLDFQGYWDFEGTLPRSVPFTAHPRFDPKTGEGFAYGVRQGMPGGDLMIYRMTPAGPLELVRSVPLGGYFMIHDMLLSRNHLIFLVPPATLDVGPMLSGKSSIGDALKFLADKPLRVLIVRRDGTGEPKFLELPPGLVFHHGNAFEREDGRLVLDSMLGPDGSSLAAIRAWRDEKLPTMSPASLTRLVIDPAGGIESRDEIDEDREFPRFDSRRTGEPARFLYAMETGGGEDPFAFKRLVRHDLEKRDATRVEAERGRAMGEPVFVPRPGGTEESDGWILVMAFDGGRDETCLEIRDATTLDLEARVWAGRHLPLGFHGNFVPA